MPRGGTLRIETASVERDRPCVQLTVTDTGCGMSRQVMAQVFEPFFTTKERGRGTGLGLSTVHGIVKQSGGDIEIHSEPGKGTSFRIVFPQTDAVVERSARKSRKALPGGAGQHLLLVEDEERLRKILERQISGMGYTVTAAANGGEALLLVNEKGIRPDLVITDLIMPNMSGRDLVDRLREINPDQCVLYMSGYVDDSVIPHGMSGPDAPFIQKPFSYAELADKIREVIGPAPAAATQ